MLDAYIIERIRQQRERQEPVHEPLRVEIPLQRPPDEPRGDDEQGDREPHRGVIVIDETI